MTKKNTGVVISDEAMQIAAQCWCDPDTQGIEMDVRLAAAFAMRLECERERAEAWLRVHEAAEAMDNVGEPEVTVSDAYIAAEILHSKALEAARKLEGDPCVEDDLQCGPELEEELEQPVTDKQQCDRCKTMQPTRSFDLLYGCCAACAWCLSLECPTDCFCGHSNGYHVSTPEELRAVMTADPRSYYTFAIKDAVDHFSDFLEQRAARGTPGD